jgi:3',5'-cyclic AMP phosphodiesterase CpdA
MSSSRGACAQLLAVSDLHVTHPENRAIVEQLRPHGDADWLIVCGDVSDTIADVQWALGLLSQRFARVLWAPGNHELWSTPEEPARLRGEARYRHLVDICRQLGVLTPEDPYPVWEGRGGPLVIAPLFLLYDYSFGRNIAPTKAQALALAHRAGVVCSDEFLLHPDPHASRDAWCHTRVAHTQARLESCDRDVPITLVNHFPLS